MIAPARPARRRKSLPAWHGGFLAMLPAITSYAKSAFSRLAPETRRDLTQEVLANCLVAYVRLFEQGRGALAYPTVLARYGIAQVREGRRVGCKLNVRDPLSPYCQRKKHVVVERLDHRDRDTGEWIEAVIEDRRTPPPDQAAFRVDFPAWLNSLTRRNRRIAESLAVGNMTGEVAGRFGITPGRVSQLRRQLEASWQQFQGDEPASTAAAHS